MTLQQNQEKVDLGELTKPYQISDPISFQRYLSVIWSDLANRSKEPQKGI